MQVDYLEKNKNKNAFSIMAVDIATKAPAPLVQRTFAERAAAENLDDTGILNSKNAAARSPQAMLTLSLSAAASTT